MDQVQRRCFFSKWLCPVHGHFSAITAEPVGESNPVHCPECKAKFVEQCAGRTRRPVPSVTKPRWPQKSDNQLIHSEKAPYRKRGRSW